MPNSERDSASTVQAAAPATSAGQALAPLSVREKLALVASARKLSRFARATRLAAQLPR